MSTAESLSAYMAYAPRREHTDAQRNLISNIHERGVRSEEAAVRITNLVAEFIRLGCSGTLVKEPAF
jgi:ethanolamine ammonia-lyase small subunit